MRRIIIIAGPSGVGKTTVSQYLQEKYHIPRVVTHTTRPKRKGEVDGKAYYFESNESFEKLHFFEHVKYGDYRYGSSKEALKRAWDKSELVSLIVETDGVKSYLEALKNKVYFIYLTVNEPQILTQRLIKRGDDTAEIEKRLNSAEFKRDLHLNKELAAKAHILKNNDWEETKLMLDKVINKLQRD